MANAIFETKLSNIKDTGSSVSTIDLTGFVPFSRNTIVSSRKFTPRTNHAFSVLPTVDFSKTSTPSRYSYTTTNTTDANGIVTAVTIDVFYIAPLNNEDVTDIITFTGQAKHSPNVSNNKIYDFNYSEKLIPSQGCSRTLKIYGDPLATCTIDFSTYPLINPNADGVSLISGPKSITIPENGVHEESTRIPKTTILTKYKITIKEDTANTFQNILTPTEKILTQYPTQHTRLTLSDSALGTTLPATTQFNFYHDYKDNNTAYDFFTFQVYKNTFNFALKPTAFDSSLFGITSGSGATYTTHTVEKTDIEFFDLNVEIDNDGVTSGDATRAYAVISGRMKILSGYDAGGRTDVTLNVNDILKSA
jgi:hypothetical protein